MPFVCPIVSFWPVFSGFAQQSADHTKDQPLPGFARLLRFLKQDNNESDRAGWKAPGSPPTRWVVIMRSTQRARTERGRSLQNIWRKSKVTEMEQSCSRYSMRACSAMDLGHQGALSQNSPVESTGVGYHFLLQGLFQTQGSNPSLLSLTLAGKFFSTEPTGKPFLFF